MDRVKEVVMIDLEETDKNIYYLKKRLNMIINEMNIYNTVNRQDLEDKYTVSRIRLIAEEQRYIRLLDDLRDIVMNDETQI